MATVFIAFTFPQNAKARLKVMDKEHKDLAWEHEVLEQRFEQVCYILLTREKENCV